MKQILDYLKTYSEEHGGIMPSFEDIRHELGIASKSEIHRALTNLELRGFIVRQPNRARAIQIVPEREVAELSQMRRFITQKGLLAQFDNWRQSA